MNDPEYEIIVEGFVRGGFVPSSYSAIRARALEEYVFIVEGGFGANFGPNWDTGVTVGGMAAGIDPDLSVAMADLVKKIKKRKLKPNKPRRATSRTGTIVDAILAVKALKAVQYLNYPD